MKVNKVSEDKKVKLRYGLKNKLIIFTYHLKLFLTLKVVFVFLLNSK